MLLKYLGFSTETQEYLVAKRENPHCSSLYSTPIYERFHMSNQKHMTSFSLVPGAKGGEGDLLREIKQRLVEPNQFVVPCVFQVTHIVNEFPTVAWKLHISNFFSGQPTLPEYMALPKPSFSQDGMLPLSHFSGELVILVPAGFRGEPEPVNRVHYLVPLPTEVIEQCCGPNIEQVNEQVRSIQGRIKYTRFEATRITCEPIADPVVLERDLWPTNAAAGGPDVPKPTLAIVFSLTYFIVTMPPPPLPRT